MFFHGYPATRGPRNGWPNSQVLMQIRNEVEQAMLDGPQRSFDEICLGACDARASDLKVTDADPHGGWFGRG